MSLFPWFTGDAWIPLVKALLHTLWQGALVAGLLYAFLKTVPASRSDVRYGASAAALMAVIFGGFTTWAVLEYEARGLASGGAAGVVAVEPPAGNIGAKESAAWTAAPPSVASTRGTAETARAAETAASGGFDFTPLIPWAAAVWFFGVTLMVSRVIVSLIGAGRLRRQCRLVSDPGIQAVVNRLCGLFGLGRRIRVAVSEHVDVPAVLGVIWPTILLPASALSGVPADHLRAIIAHELAHIRRYDYLVNLAQMVVEALLFFNPMVWWISRRVRIEREACCDAMAAEATGDKVEYARALSEVARSVRPPVLAFQAVQAMTGPPESHGLFDRVKRILVPGHRPNVRLPWYTILAVLVSSGFILAGILAGSRASVTLAAKILSPQERIEKLNELSETHGPSLKADRTREYDLQTEGITVSGTVVTEDDSPLPRVRLKAMSNRPSYTAGHTINLDGGRFSQKVQFGTVYMRADADGYAPAFVGPLESVPGGLIENIRVVLERGYEGRIEIVDEEGKPLEDATVSGTYDHECSYPGVEAATGADGIAVFDRCTTVGLKLSAGADGYQTDSRTVVFRPGETVTWKLKPAQPATGVVVSKETGKPIPNAELRLLKIKGPKSHGWGVESAKTIAATDENGRFVLDRLRSDSMYTFFVEAPDHGRQFLKNVMAGQEDLKVELGPEIYVRGKIVGSLDKLGKRRGAMGFYYSNPYRLDGGSHSSQEWVPIELKDGEGHFRIPNLFAGTLRIYAGPRQKVLKLTEALDDLVIDLAAEPEPGTETATQTETRPVVLRFKVPEGSPLPTGELTVTHLVEKGSGRYMKPEQVPIENGEVRLEVPVPTKVGYRTDGLTGYWVKRTWGEDVEPGEEPFEMTVEAIPAGAIYGTVGEADGSPARSSFIGVIVAERSPLMPQGSLDVDIKNSTSNDSDFVSKFMAGPLPLGGKYAIILHRDQTYAVSEAIELTEAEPIKQVGLRYGKGVTVRGEVLRPDGEPAAGIQFRFNYSTPYSHGFGGSEKWTDREGRFVFENVNPDVPGTYSITINENLGYRPARVELNPVDRPVKIRLERGRVLTGVILDAATGWPIPGMEVFAMARDYRLREPSGYLDADAKTNDRGEFKFTTLGPIEYTLEVRGGKVVQPGSAIAIGGRKKPVTLRVELSKRTKLKPVKPRDLDR